MTARARDPQDASGPAGLTPDVERVVRAAQRLSPGVWRQLGKWLRTREGTAGPWDPDDPPVLAQIANEVDEIADALAALRVAPAASGHYCTASKSACERCYDAPAAPGPGR